MGVGFFLEGGGGGGGGAQYREQKKNVVSLHGIAVLQNNFIFLLQFRVTYKTDVTLGFSHSLLGLCFFPRLIPSSTRRKTATSSFRASSGRQNTNQNSGCQSTTQAMLDHTRLSSELLLVCLPWLLLLLSSSSSSLSNGSTDVVLMVQFLAKYVAMVNHVRRAQ